MHQDGRGGSQEEFPSSLGRSWLSAMTRGGLGWQARASTPNLAKGRKVQLQTGKQLFATLQGMWEQSCVAGTGVGADGGGALREWSLTQMGRQGLCQERHQPLCSWIAVLQHTQLHSRQCCHMLDIWSSKKPSSRGPTDSVCQAESVHECTGLVNSAATVLGMQDLLSPIL